MRILWLEHAGRVARYDNWLHTKFAEELAKKVDFFMFYAPWIHETLGSLTPKHYHRSDRFKDIVNEYKIDTVIMSTRSSMYDNYSPKTVYPDRENVGNLWLPPDFADTKVFKICIEEDYQYEVDDRWYKEMGIKVMLQKHYVFSKHKDALPVEFFPFSVDTNVFKPTNTNRKSLVGFCGTTDTANSTSGGSVYKPREMALRILRSKGLLTTDTHEGCSHYAGDKYVKYLQEYLIYLSCGSIYNLTPAKMTEIMGSGGILLTNQTLGLDILFDKGTYITYNETGTDLEQKVKEVINDKKLSKQMIDGALDCIIRKHSHEVRIKELLNLIEKYR